jgi:hypothetical protein
VVVCCGFDLWVTAGDDFSAVTVQPQQRQKTNAYSFSSTSSSTVFWGEEFWDGESFVGSTQILGYAKAMGHGYSVSRGGDSNHWSVNLSPPQNQVQTI